MLFSPARHVKNVLQNPLWDARLGMKDHKVVDQEIRRKYHNVVACEFQGVAGVTGYRQYMLTIWYGLIPVLGGCSI